MRSDKTTENIAIEWGICNMPRVQRSQKTKLMSLLTTSSISDDA